MSHLTEVSDKSWIFPADIIINIFKNLNIVDIALCQRVSKLFKSIINSDALWLVKVKDALLYKYQDISLKNVFFRIQKFNTALNKNRFIKKEYTFPHAQLWVTTAAVYKEYVIVGLNNGDLFGWNFQTTEHFYFLTDETQNYRSQIYIDTTPTSQIALFEKNIFGISGFEKELNIWSADDDSERGLCISSLTDWLVKDKAIHAIATKGTFLILGTTTKIIAADHEDFFIKKTLQAATILSPVTSLVSNDDTSYFYSGHEDASLCIWEIESTTQLVPKLTKNSTIHYKENFIGMGISHLFLDRGILVSCIQEVTSKVMQFFSLNHDRLIKIFELKLEENPTSYTSLTYLNSHLFCKKQNVSTLLCFNLMEKSWFNFPNIVINRFYYSKRDELIYSAHQLNKISLLKISMD